VGRSERAYEGHCAGYVGSRTEVYKRALYRVTWPRSCHLNDYKRQLERGETYRQGLNTRDACSLHHVWCGCDDGKHNRREQNRLGQQEPSCERPGSLTPCSDPRRDASDEEDTEPAHRATRLTTCT